MYILLQRVEAEFEGCIVGKAIAGRDPYLRGRVCLYDLVLSISGCVYKRIEGARLTRDIAIDVVGTEIIEDRESYPSIQGQAGVDRILVAQVQGALQSLFSRYGIGRDERVAALGLVIAGV